MNQEETMYKPKYQEVAAYLHNDEAKSSTIWDSEIQISIEDVEIIIDRVISNTPTDKPSESNTETAVGKVESAIDKMDDLQDMGFGWLKVSEILELLKSLSADFQAGEIENSN